VRFSSFTTTKSHIQGSGRARKWGARVFYFDNDPKREVEGAELLQRTARESSLSLTDAQMQESRAHADVEGTHPYRTASGAEVSVFNCVQLVYEYAARTMGQSFRPEESMLTYEEEVVSDLPPLRRKKLVAARIPSPDGFFDVRADAVDGWWGDLDMRDIAEKGRMKNWDSSDKELRRFLYVVAVEMSRRGYLDENNQPTSRALRETRHACEAWQMSPGVKIGVRYDLQGLDAASVARMPAADAAVRSISGSTSTASSSAPAQRPPVGAVPVASAPAVPSPVPAQKPPVGAAFGASPLAALSFSPAQRPPVGAAPDVENYKARLNELLMRPSIIGVSYRTVQADDGFRAVVTLPDGRSFDAPGCFSSKKAAEQAAAEAAVRQLEGSLPTRAASSAGSAAPAPIPRRAATAAAPRQNYKGQLNEITQGRATYTTAAVPNGFVASVSLPDGRCWQSSMSATTKKEAEQLAAQAACAAMGTEAPRAAALAPAAAAAGAAPVAAAAESEELRSRILDDVLREGVVPLVELVRRCNAPKADVNRQLHELQAEGLLRKVVESPPVWAVAS